jgi:two-component system sensor histidine kinase ChiS
MQVGQVGTDISTTVPCHSAKLIDIPPLTERIELVLQVASFHHNLGGVADRIVFGDAYDLQRDQKITSGMILFVVGSLFIMGIYHLVLFVLRRRDLSSLYFGSLCLIFSVFQMAMNPKERFLATLFPSLTWERLYQIDYLAFALSVPGFIMFIHSLFPRESLPKVLRAFQISALVFALIILLTPGHVSINTVLVYQAIALMGVLYMTWVLFQAARCKRDGSLFLLSGFAVFFLVVVNDILYNNRIIQTGFLTPWALFFLVLPHSFVLSMRFSRAFTAVENLSQELEEKNIALSRMDRLKDEFLAKTSHELRTPLNGIIGIAESLLGGIGGTVSRVAASNLTMIASSGKRLANLVNDILDFSKLKNRDIQLYTKPTDIFGLVEVVIGTSRHLDTGENLELINAVPERCPLVLGDEDRLQQILFNLVGNAIKFTDEGKIIISAIPGDAVVEISVSDTGIGIAPDKIEDIFQSFEQADASDTRAFGGTGLGLSITRRLVELHGGDIQVESKIGRGSTFSFTMPVSQEQPTQASPPKVPETADDATYTNQFAQTEIHDSQPSTRDSYQVLVVDDDPVNLQVVANHLMLEQISFQTASGGMAALKRIEAGEKPHIILLDIMMPKITGYEVCRRLRKTYSPAELPIIMLTARNQVTDLVAAYKAGASDYISKPISKDVLISRVNCQLSLKAAYDAILEKQRLEKELFQQKQEKEHARLQAEKEKLEKLRYQLNPHFLFNALASIRGAVLRDKQAAYEMVSHLSEFSRLSLTRGSLAILTIAQELEVIRHYLDMEQMRFGDYLTVSIDIEPHADVLQIPALVLHPLVENAIKYGSRTCPDALDVTIGVKTLPSDKIRLAVSNSGRWVEPGTTDGRYSTETGIQNIKQRLKRYYAGDYRFEVHSDKHRVSVVIVVPRSIEEQHKRLQHEKKEMPGDTHEAESNDSG